MPVGSKHASVELPYRSHQLCCMEDEDGGLHCLVICAPANDWLCVPAHLEYLPT